MGIGRTGRIRYQFGLDRDRLPAMSGRRTAPRVLLTVAIVTMVVSVIGFVVTLILNAFFLDRYNAYGEVSIPGSASLHLPAGETTISFHTQIIGTTTSGGGLPVPDLRMNIDPPAGVADPVVTESFSSTTTVNSDARVRVWVAQIPVEGDYKISTDGNVSAFISPRLAFGHASTQGALPMIFAAVFGVALLDLIISLVWLSRLKRAAVPAFGATETTAFTPTFAGPTDAAPRTPMFAVPHADRYTVTDDGVRIEQLKTLAALRDSGALTQDEFETEKRKLLDGR
ncbi:SHOCT domain-containing protein [soil metagenome]